MTMPSESQDVSAVLSEPQKRALKALVNDGDLYAHSTGNGTVLVGPAETKVCGIDTASALVKRGLAKRSAHFVYSATHAGRQAYAALRQAANKGAE